WVGWWSAWWCGPALCSRRENRPKSNARPSSSCSGRAASSRRNRGASRTTPRSSGWRASSTGTCIRGSVPSSWCRPPLPPRPRRPRQRSQRRGADATERRLRRRSVAPCPETSTQAELGGGFGGAGLIERTDAAGQLTEEVAGEGGRVLEDTLEPTGVDHVHLHRRPGDDGRRPGAVVEQGHLTDDPTRADRADHLIADGPLRLAPVADARRR